MKILLVGNMGYVGPLVATQLRNSFPDASIVGFDKGIFAHCLTTIDSLPESVLNAQYFGDVRSFDPILLRDVDTIVYLAAISNDPMGNAFEELTWEVNHQAAIDMAKQARNFSVKTFVYASSCSVYGLSETKPRTEDDPVDPLTPYAKSKVCAENDLSLLADSRFVVTCLRFATACGMSPRLRLDLVLNDFVASALTSNRIEILSDGTPWRPLVHVSDMALAIEWATIRPIEHGSPFLAVNVGSNTWNYRVSELAESVAEVIPGTDITFSKNGAPDKRSYRVDFSCFSKLAVGYTPRIDLAGAIDDLLIGLQSINFSDSNFRNSSLVRLLTLDKFIQKNM